MSNRNLWAVGIAGLLSACAGASENGIGSEIEIVVPACDYSQIHGTSTHGGTACIEQTGLRVVAVLGQDPDVDAEVAESGFLPVHESAPLTSANMVVIPKRAGFTGGATRQTATHAVDAYRWVPGVGSPGATLVPAWTARTDYQTIDGAIGPAFTNGFVAMFQPAIANGSVYVPARAGRLLRLDLDTGAVQAVIDPLAGTAFSGDARTVGVGALSVDSIGRVLYTVTAFNATSNSNGVQPRASFLARVLPSNTTELAPWTSVASASIGVPQTTSACEYPFGTSGTAPAKDSTSRPPQFGCGSQRPGMNAAPAIGADGHIVVLTHANNAVGTAFLVELDDSLTPIRAMSTVGHMLHGCGVRLDPKSQACRIITDGGATNFGFDPAFNTPVRFRGFDIVSGSPTIGPDGSLTISGYTGGFTFGGGFDARGGQVAFGAGGTFRAVNDEFGMDVTPSSFAHDGTFSYLQDRNLYSLGDLGVARYSPAFVLEQQSKIPPDANAATPDFLDANIAFDITGTRYAVNGDGHLYKFGVDGRLLERVALPGKDGNVRSVITLSNFVARDRAGRIYLSYAGSVYVIEGGGTVSTAFAPALASSSVVTAQNAKSVAIAAAELVSPPLVAGNPAVWMLGTWNCKGGYFDVPPFVSHSTTGEYTFTQDVTTGGAVKGSFVELTSDHPEIKPVNFGELWSIGDVAGSTAPASVETLNTDGSSISASGVSFPPNATGSVIGGTSVQGKILLADGSVRVWSGGTIATPKPDRFSLNHRIEIRPGAQQVYLQMSCVRRVD